jgi:hypothetical protein
MREPNPTEPVNFSFTPILPMKEVKKCQPKEKNKDACLRMT